MISIFSALQIFLINLVWSSVSIIVKFELRLAAEACFLNSLAHIEWNVPSQDKHLNISEESKYDIDNYENFLTNSLKKFVEYDRAN